MKIFRNILVFSLLLACVVTLVQCSSIPKLEKNRPLTFETVYYQKWNAGTQEGGSGINVYLQSKKSSVQLDSIYFRGHKAKLQPDANNSLLYVGRFKSNDNTSNLPFKLEDDECVVSYVKANKVRYFKISNLNERKSLNYPNASPKPFP